MRTPWTASGRWTPATIEDVKVRGGASDQVLIVETIHGPVVAGDPAHGTALALKSVQFFDLDRALTAQFLLGMPGSDRLAHSPRSLVSLNLGGLA
jgi:hypothetical protein